MPLTFAAHVAVCVVLIADGVAVTETPVIATEIGAATMLMLAEPFLVPSCVDVAVQVPEPGPEGVKTPAWVMVPPVAVQATDEP